MKRKLSLVVLFAMVAVACLGVLTACGDLDNFALETLTGKVEDQFVKAVGTSYTLDSVVKYTDENEKEVTCNVKWTADSGVTVTDGNNVVTVTVPGGVTSYILKGTLVNGKGEAYKLDGEKCEVQKSITVSGGTVDPNPNPNPNPNPSPSGDKGTQGNPYTVAEALAVIDGLAQGGYSTSAVYTTGIVSNYESGDKGQYRFNIADTAGSSSTICVYWADLGSGVTSFKDGDTVVVYGYLMHFWNNKTSTKTPEVAKNNNVNPSVVSVNGSSIQTPTPTPTPDPTPAPTPSGTLIGTLSLAKVTPTSNNGTEQKTYTANGLTVINDKASSTDTMDLKDSVSAKFYRGSTMTFQSTTAFTTIVIHADNYQSGKYVKGFDGMTVAGATITASGETTTIVLSSSTTSWVSGELLSQLRITSIDFYA